MNGQASSFRPQFTKIKDVSDRRRLPRLGKIRLGVKVVSQKTGREYPKETEYFVVPEEVAKIYGDKPKELDVMFAVNDIETVFPQRLVWFGASRGIKCIGDGERAMRIEEPDGTRYDAMKERTCPCELLDHGCSRRAHLLVILPKVSVSGIYQIDVGSYNSIVDVNSGMDYVQALVGRFAMVPLVLRRTPRETHGSGRKETHFTLGVYLPESGVDFLNVLRESTQRILSGPKYALPAPVVENPAADEGATIEMEVEEENGKEPETPPQTPPPVTPEEELKALKEKGMVDNGTSLMDSQTIHGKNETARDIDSDRKWEPEPTGKVGKIEGPQKFDAGQGKETPKKGDSKPEEKPEGISKAPEEKKLDEAKFMNEVATKMSRMKTKKEVMDWYNENKLSLKATYSAGIFAEITRAVNDKLGKMKG